MPTLTITEALAEVKTAQKRIAAKREYVQQYLARQDYMKDPLEKHDGSPAVIKRELQAIRDLETNIVRIRGAIQRKNHEVSITVADETRTVADWLSWRREIVEQEQAFNAQLRGAIDNFRRQAAAKNIQVTPAGSPTANQNDLVINLDEGELASRIERITVILGTLDGQLSLKNATTMIEY